MRLLSLTVPFVSRILSRAFLVVLTVALFSCDKVPLTAPTGSTVQLTVNTTRLPLNGTAEITAVVTEAAGTAPQNGTSVTFTTTLGTIEPSEARTTNGLATATFRAGSTSGTARIGAVSGSASAEAVEVAIGGAAATGVALRAEPASVPTTGGTVTLVATVIDEAGNGLPGVPVTFSVNFGQLSQGSVISDANGEARVTLTTNRDTTVTARAGAQQATLTVTAIAVPVVTIATTNVSPEAGVPIQFTLTPATGTNANAIRDVVIDWGDGSAPQNIGAVVGSTTVTHVFNRAGTFTVTATATDTQGLTGRSSIVITVGQQGTIAATLAANPNPTSISNANQLGLTTFTATTTGLAAGETIRLYEWNFGDGRGTQTTGNSVPKFYGEAGQFVARVRVVTTLGREGFAEVTVRVLG